MQGAKTHFLKDHLSQSTNGDTQQKRKKKMNVQFAMCEILFKIRAHRAPRDTQFAERQLHQGRTMLILLPTFAAESRHLTFTSHNDLTDDDLTCFSLLCYFSFMVFKRFHVTEIFYFFVVSVISLINLTHYNGLCSCYSIAVLCHFSLCNPSKPIATHTQRIRLALPQKCQLIPYVEIAQNTIDSGPWKLPQYINRFWFMESTTKYRLILVNGIFQKISIDSGLWKLRQNINSFWSVEITTKYQLQALQVIDGSRNFPDIIIYVNSTVISSLIMEVMLRQ